jgi:hypothetical protein
MVGRVWPRHRHRGRPLNAIVRQRYGGVMIGDIIGEIVGQVVGEILIKGPGYFIVRRIKGSDDFNPDGFVVLLAGIAFWVLIMAAGYGVYRYVSGSAA